MHGYELLPWHGLAYGRQQQPKGGGGGGESWLVPCRADKSS
jgi:hypothetical protein